LHNVNVGRATPRCAGEKYDCEDELLDVSGHSIVPLRFSLQVNLSQSKLASPWLSP
jgi:hypothetical protein